MENLFKFVVVGAALMVVVLLISSPKQEEMNTSALVRNLLNLVNEPEKQAKMIANLESESSHEAIMLLLFMHVDPNEEKYYQQAALDTLSQFTNVSEKTQRELVRRVFTDSGLRKVAAVVLGSQVSLNRFVRTQLENGLNTITDDSEILAAIKIALQKDSTDGKSSQ